MVWTFKTLLFISKTETSVDDINETDDLICDGIKDSLFNSDITDDEILEALKNINP
jgi:hypothetical protein